MEPSPLCCTAPPDPWRGAVAWRAERLFTFLTRRMVTTGAAVLGFVGSPWTLATYIVEGKCVAMPLPALAPRLRDCACAARCARRGMRRGGSCANSRSAFGEVFGRTPPECGLAARSLDSCFPSLSGHRTRTGSTAKEREALQRQEKHRKWRCRGGKGWAKGAGRVDNRLASEPVTGSSPKRSRALRPLPRSTPLYSNIKTMALVNPTLLMALLDNLATAVADYILYQIASGAQAIMLFDSWGGQLPPAQWDAVSRPSLEAIVRKVKAKHPEVRSPGAVALRPASACAVHSLGFAAAAAQLPLPCAACPLPADRVLDSCSRHAGPLAAAHCCRSYGHLFCPVRCQSCSTPTAAAACWNAWARRGWTQWAWTGPWIWRTRAGGWGRLACRGMWTRRCSLLRRRPSGRRCAINAASPLQVYKRMARSRSPCSARAAHPCAREHAAVEPRTSVRNSVVAVF